jgi:phosphatidylglycerophosphate synthase
MYRLLDEMDGK